MHLIKRTDTSLATALILGAIIVFQQPLRWLFDIAHDIERRFHMDLVPALTVLTVLMFDIDHSKSINDEFGHLSGPLRVRS